MFYKKLLQSVRKDEERKEEKNEEKTKMYVSSPTTGRHLRCKIHCNPIRDHMCDNYVVFLPVDIAIYLQCGMPAS